MQDTRALRDDRYLPLDSVGVAGLCDPIVVLDRRAEKQRTVGTLAMSVSLPREQKGTHLRHFIECLSDHHGGEPQLVWIEELIEVAERSASALVYPLLERPDEKAVTEQAYDNPVSVEDMVRNVARRLDDPRIAWFEVHTENHESIHNHAAFFAQFASTRGVGR